MVLKQGGYWVIRKNFQWMAYGEASWVKKIIGKKTSSLLP